MTRPIPSTVSNNKSNNSTRRSASSNAIANWRKKPLTQNPKTRRKSVSARRAFPSAPPMATSRSICEASCNWTREHLLKTAGSRAMMVSCCDARNSSNADVEDHQESRGRLYLRPLMKSNLSALQRFALGVGGSDGDSSTVSALPATTGGTAPGYVTDGQQQFFAYRNTVVAG